MSSPGREVKGGPGRFARRLLREWRLRGWPLRGERLVVAVSGGADSTALLLALEELRRVPLLEVEVTAAHLDHGLRGEEAAADALWVERLAREQGFGCVVGRASVSELVLETGDNLEQAARRARYEFLSEAARACGARAVLAAHTLDDQAETVLLRLLRGSGAEGLGGMVPERALEVGSEVSLRRPLLNWARRADTESYCRERGVEFRADAMNEDERFARVRVRRRLLPLLESFNPRAAETLSRTAALLREDSTALEDLATALLAAALTEDTEGTTTNPATLIRPLRVEALTDAKPALRRRALRLWLARARGDLRRLSHAHLLGVERLLEGARGGRVAELPGGARVERRRGLLHFRPAAETSTPDEP
ncbi:MAG: tRNA lysidine(34) synthetase TilS [Acidobacteria bacterium]|nr:tRNA lysidine(34) synthetase TilS [Acidobacteriota bacterium]